METELLMAACFGVAITCSSYLLIHHKQRKRALAERFAEIGYAGAGRENNTDALYRESETLSKKDRFSNDLYLAGVRTAKQRRFFYVMLKMSWIVPFVIMGLYFMNGVLDADAFIQSAGIGLLLYAWVIVLVRMMRQRRQKRVLRVLPQFLDLIVVCMEAGLGFAASLERVLKEVDPREPLTQEFKLMYHEFLGGLSLSEACERMDKRCRVPDVSVLLGSIVQSEEMGASLGDTLRITAIDLRDKYRERMRTRAHKIPVKILFPILLIFATIYFLSLGPSLYQLKKFSASQTT